MLKIQFPEDINTHQLTDIRPIFRREADSECLTV
jgi:hypothetical protein